MRIEPGPEIIETSQNIAVANLDSEKNEQSMSEGGLMQKFVTFAVGAEEYAVDIMKVREIQAWTDVTVLPNQPDYMRGVLNLRGLIVPIFDLRCRFGQGITEATQLHVVVIIAIEDRIVGVLVDRVSDILTVESQDIRPVPDIEGRSDSQYILGLVTAEERMVALLDTGNLLSSEVLDEGMAAGAGSAPD